MLTDGRQNAGQAVAGAQAAKDAAADIHYVAAPLTFTQEVVAEAIAGRRDECFIVTKVLPENSTRARMVAACERSLKRLVTDHVDLVQLHSCALAELQKGDVIEALERARERGWTRYIGYSGDSEAAQYAVECGRFDTLQTSVSIADQEAIELTLPLAHRRRIGVIAKRPLANVAWRYAKKPDSYYEDYWMRLKRLDYPFLRGPSDAGVATALRFTLSVPGVHTAIVGTTKPERCKQNASLLAAGPLPAREADRIRARWHEVADASWVGQV